MKFKNLMVLASLLLIFSSVGWSQNIMTLDNATGTYGTSTDTLEVGQDVDIFIRWTQTNATDTLGNPANVSGFTLGFKIYSDDGAQWIATDSGAFTGVITAGMIDFSFINTFSLDGMGADTVAFSGFALFGTEIPNGFDEVVWSISLGTIDVSQACKTICIDSAFFPPGGPWQWATGGSFIPDWGGPYCFLIFDPANPCPEEPPVLAAIGAQSVKECVPLNVPLFATHSTDSVSFRTVNDPGGTITRTGDKTADWDWTPTAGDNAGSPYSVIFIATAASGGTDSETVAITVTADGTPAFTTVPPQTITECLQLSVLVSATDPEATSMTLSIQSGPAGSAITDNGDGTGTVTWTPAAGDAGTPTIIVAATDACGTVGTVDIAVTVDPDGAPTFANPGAQTVKECELLSFAVSATDPEGSVPTLSIQSGPAGASLADNGNGTGTVTWTPAAGDAGTPTITVAATDACGSVGTFDIGVTVNPDGPPVFVDPGAQAATECLAFNVQTSATDPEGSTPSFDKVSGPAGATLTDNADGTFDIDWTPVPGDAGANTVRVSATDVCGTVTNLDVVITVAADGAPVFVDPGAQAATECIAFNVQTSATDPEGSTPSFDKVSGPAGATLTDNADGTFDIDWTPVPGDAGANTVRVSATDACGSVTNLDVVITVAADGAPAFADPGAQAGTECIAFNVQASATDPEGSTPSFAKVSGPAGATVTDNADGTFDIDWTPVPGDAGANTVRVSATDGCGTVTNLDVVITVAADGAPAFVDPGAQTGTECVAFSLTVSATDPEASTPSFALVSGPAGATVTDNTDGTADIDWTPAAGDAGANTITVSATDGCGTVTNLAVVVTVAVNNTPTFTDPGTQTMTQGDTVTVVLAYSDLEADAVTVTVDSTGLLSGENFILDTQTLTDTATFVWRTTTGTFGGVDSVAFFATDGCSTDTLYVIFTIATGVTIAQPGVLPDNIYLSQNYPNPFNPITEIDFKVAEQSHVILAVYNVVGQKIRTLVDESMSANVYTVFWDATADNGARVSSGIYFYRLETAGYQETRKMVLLK